MKLQVTLLAAVLSGPAYSQTPPTDPVVVMERILEAFSAIDQPPEDVLAAFLPETAAQQETFVTDGALLEVVTDPQLVLFHLAWVDRTAAQPRAVTLTCVRFGPETLAFAQGPDAGLVKPMVLDMGADFSSPTYAPLTIPELGGAVQTFPRGAVLRQDCELRYDLPTDTLTEEFAPWREAAMTMIHARFGSVTETEGANPFLSAGNAVRASAWLGDPIRQIPFIYVELPHDDTEPLSFTGPSLGLRAVTYLFGPGS